MSPKTRSNLDQIKKLRADTGVGVMDARRALEESGGDPAKARDWLKTHAVAQSASKADRDTTDGAIFAYVHQTGKVAALVKLGCETDFVARTPDFQKLGRELAMQLASMDPKDPQELLVQDWIRHPEKTIKELVDEHIAKLGENIQVLEIARMKI